MVPGSFAQAKRRALDGQHPGDTARIIAWYEAAARHWDAAPTPFEWGGTRAGGQARAGGHEGR